jgi:outer membrane protein insertion porin family
MPVVNAPFRLYWAYNPSRVQTAFQPPIVADRSMFPNDATYQNALQTLQQYGTFGLGIARYTERSSTFRFSIGRTF